MHGATTLGRLIVVRLAPAVAWLLLLAAVASLARGEMASDDPNGVLRRFLGAWQTEAHLHKAGPPASDVVTRGTAECRQTLGGRYFEFRTQTVPAGEADLQVMTYDPASRLYRQWVFSSDGYSHEAAGRWDVATSTLEWRGKSGGTEFVILDHWVSTDRLEWTLRRTKADGTLVQTITGTVSRAVGETQP
jgi:hypothetical protein